MIHKTKIFTPVFNKKEIKNSFLNYDTNYLVRELETVLFPGLEILQIGESIDGAIEIKTDHYLSEKPIYALENFFQNDVNEKSNISLDLPKKSKVLERLMNFPKLPYIWGGNIIDGIDELLSWIPPKKMLNTFDYNYWRLRGVDCSGLLYFVTNGNSFRNTSDMVLKYPQVNKLRPLDLIAWKGHVIIYLNEQLVIESRFPDGVIRTNFTKRMKEIEKFEPKFLRFL
jgi:hypothetical protein